MYSLKQLIVVQLATGFFNETKIRELMYSGELDKWQQLVREKLPANVIPITLQDEIISLMTSMEREVPNWLEDHREFFPYEYLLHFKFSWNSDGTVDRKNTANLLILSKWLDVQRRFVLAGQYWPSEDFFRFFNSLPDSERRGILF